MSIKKQSGLEVQLHSFLESIINDLGGRGISLFFKCTKQYKFKLFSATELKVYTKGCKMSNNNKINSDRLAGTINTADNGNSLL